MTLFSPAFFPGALSREELIVYYSRQGLSVEEIRRFLRDIHGYSIRFEGNWAVAACVVMRWVLAPCILRADVGPRGEPACVAWEYAIVYTGVTRF